MKTKRAEPFTVTAANGAKMDWHEAAQAHLEATGLNAPTLPWSIRSAPS